METKEPKHIGIILDGNRRFAKSKMLEPWKGHLDGAKTVENLFDWALELKIKQLTLYCLSTENLKRPKQEVDFLMDVMKKEFLNLNSAKNQERLKKEGVKLKFIGNLDLISKDLREECFKLEKKTEKNSNLVVNFAIAYGGRQEIVEAVKKIVQSGVDFNEVNEELIKEHLFLKDEPDLIIRTGGEIRTSNFLPFQSTYSEWFFVDKLWPEFTKEDLIKVIEDFKKRKRNFGK